MRKKIAFISILFLLAVVTSIDTQSLEDSSSKIEINLTDVLDLSAPTIVLNMSLYNTTGEFNVSIIENDSNIESYTIELNGTDLTPDVEFFYTTAHLVQFEINANFDFNDTTLWHNYLEIYAFNDAVAPSPHPTINQPGGGGGGGFGFCDDIDCWGPTPLAYQSITKGSPVINTEVTDTTAPFGIIDLTGYKCCGNVDLLNFTDAESAVNFSATYLDTNMKSFFANNTEGVSQWLNITWEVPPPPTKTSYIAFSGFLVVVLFAVYAQRRKNKS